MVIATYNEANNIEIQLVVDFGKAGILRVKKHLWGFIQEWLIDPERTALFNDEITRLFFEKAREVKNGEKV